MHNSPINLFNHLTYTCTDIEAVTKDLIGRWDSYARVVLVGMSDDAQQCILDMFTYGSLECRDECELLGYEFQDTTPNLCKNTFLDEMQSVLQPYRQTCIATILAHQMSRACVASDASDRDEIRKVEARTFAWWKATFKVSISWNLEDCPYYVD